MNTDTLIMLDAGHGENTPGKRSPDGRLREYAFARLMVQRIARRLMTLGITSLAVTPETTDIPLAERVRRANAAFLTHHRDAVLLSIHCNAAGCGQWTAAHGWSVHVDPTASATSRRLADCLHDAAVSHGLTVRRSLPRDKYITQPLYICGRHAAYPAVLTENLFQDNRQDVEFLLSEAGRQCIEDLHVDAIKAFLSLG